jgi:hypothetical protein
MSIRHLSWALLLACSAGCGGSPEDEGNLLGESESELVAADPARIAHTKFVVSRTVTDTAATAFVSHPDYLAMNVPYAPVKSLFSALTTALGARLATRGEAHVTVLMPAEVSVLARKLPMSEIDALARTQGLQARAWSPVCLGVGVASSNRALQTYYVVVRSEALVAFRRTVRDRFVARGGSASAFDAEGYTPHITLGFTQKDLFESDGVTKDVRSCPVSTNLQTL